MSTTRAEKKLDKELEDLRKEIQENTPELSKEEEEEGLNLKEKKEEKEKTEEDVVRPSPSPSSSSSPSSFPPPPAPLATNNVPEKVHVRRPRPEVKLTQNPTLVVQNWVHNKTSSSSSSITTTSSSLPFFRQLVTYGYNQTTWVFDELQRKLIALVADTTTTTTEQPEKPSSKWAENSLLNVGRPLPALPVPKTTQDALRQRLAFESALLRKQYISKLETQGIPAAIEAATTKAEAVAEELAVPQLMSEISMQMEGLSPEENQKLRETVEHTITSRVEEAKTQALGHFIKKVKPVLRDIEELDQTIRLLGGEVFIVE